MRKKKNYRRGGRLHPGQDAVSPEGDGPTLGPPPEGIPYPILPSGFSPAPDRRAPPDQRNKAYTLLYKKTQPIF